MPKPENLIPAQKGEVRNPNGKAKGTLNKKTTLRKWLQVEEKKKNPISNIATVGYYYWKHGSDFIKYAEQMIEKNIRVNNEFYVCPVFNQAIKDKKQIKIFNVKGMWGLGTPEDLKYYLEKLMEWCPSQDTTSGRLLFLRTSNFKHFKHVD